MAGPTDARRCDIRDRPDATEFTASAAVNYCVEAMHAKIRAGGHASPYRLRKQLPEPVFGQIKQARGFRQFLLQAKRLDPPPSPLCHPPLIGGPKS